MRERLKALRTALYEKAQATQMRHEERTTEIYDGKEKAHRNDFDGDFACKEETKEIEDIDSDEKEITDFSIKIRLE